MRDSLFSIWTVDRPHLVAGHLLRAHGWKGKIWVVDERVEQYLAGNRSRSFLTRLCPVEPEGFTISFSTILPVPEGVVSMMAGQEEDDAEAMIGSSDHIQASRQSDYAMILYAAILSE